MTQATKSKASSKAKEVKLLKTVQLEPGKEPVKPGKHKLSAEIADSLIASGLAVEPTDESSEDAE